MRLILVAFALLVAACSSPAESAADRLVVLSNGAVITVDRDGSQPLTIASTPEGSYFQPVWSPDRELLAFGLTGARSAITVARLSDGEVFTSETSTFPFYFSWSANNELGILRNGGQGLNLETLSLGESGLGTPDVVATGGPLYYSWSPDGAEFAAHIGVDQLVVSDRNQTDSLADSPGTFAAPAWTDRGIYAVTSAGDQQSLVLIDRNGSAEVLATVGSTTNFVVNRDGSLIAVQTLAPEQQFQSASFQATPRVPANRLVVLDPVTGETTPVTNEPVLAFFWSPADDSLLILDLVEGSLGRWSVWSGRTLSELVRFGLDQTFFMEFVPFFDQYAQSASLWSPSGDAIAFPGTVDGRSGIWVQEVNGDPTWISDGSWVSWAP